MKATQTSIEWAETLLIYLHEASKEYRYWDELYETVKSKNPITVFLRCGKTIDQIRIGRDQALQKFLHHHKS